LLAAVEQDGQPHRAEALRVDHALVDGVTGGRVGRRDLAAVLVRLVAELADLVRHVDPDADDILAAVAADVPIQPAIRATAAGPAAAEAEYRLERIHEAHAASSSGRHLPGANSTRAQRASDLAGGRRRPATGVSVAPRAATASRRAPARPPPPRPRDRARPPSSGGPWGSTDRPATSPRRPGTGRAGRSRARRRRARSHRSASAAGPRSGPAPASGCRPRRSRYGAR